MKVVVAAAAVEAVAEQGLVAIGPVVLTRRCITTSTTSTTSAPAHQRIRANVGASISTSPRDTMTRAAQGCANNAPFPITSNICPSSYGSITITSDRTHHKHHHRTAEDSIPRLDQVRQYTKGVADAVSWYSG